MVKKLHNLPLIYSNGQGHSFMESLLLVYEQMFMIRIWICKLLSTFIYSPFAQESTKDAELIAVSNRSGNGERQVYEFEYKVDSTRGGTKRIFSAAFVSSRKLYILNIAHSDKPENPIDMQRRKTLEQILHSFDAVALT